MAWATAGLRPHGVGHCWAETSWRGPLHSRCLHHCPLDYVSDKGCMSQSINESEHNRGGPLYAYFSVSALRGGFVYRSTLVL